VTKLAADFDVRLAGEGDVDAVLTALSDGYGRPFTREWYEWKHRENPWGPSRCWVAEDAGGLLGVVFGMPWSLARDGRPVSCSRLVDGATTVRAQRRGVFRAVVAAELTAAAAGSPGLVIATATPEARAAHVKNGASALEPIDAYYRPVLWAPTSLVAGRQLLDTWASADKDRFGTAWDGSALRWRLDPRSDVEYEVSALANGERSHGAVHRTVGRGVRTLVVSATWGETGDVTHLLRALAWKSKAVAVLAPAGPGSRTVKPRVGIARGSSLLCVWDQGQEPMRGADDRRGWALDGLDLEGVI
jgi:hypothetical protein